MEIWVSLVIDNSVSFCSMFIICVKKDNLSTKEVYVLVEIHL